VGSVFREFFYLFLDSHWDIRHIHIIVLETKEEIDHVENLYRLIGYPGCVGSVDCVHVPWGAFTRTLQTQCKNKQKETPPVVFEVVCSHTTRVLNMSDIFWGACGDSLIVKYDTAMSSTTRSEPCRGILLGGGDGCFSLDGVVHCCWLENW
jgi:hypothetical protein